METNHPSHNDKNTKNSKQKNMVWKMKRRSSREQAKEASSLIREHLNNSSKIKSCTKREFDHSSQNSSQTSSSINCCDQSTLRDQSTRSGRSIGSRSGNIRFSGNSRGSGSSAGRGIETPAGEQDSCTSGSNISRASSARASQRSKTSQLSLPIGKAVCFSEIHIRDYERVVGDNPSCSAGPPIGYVYLSLSCLVLL